MFFFVTPLSAKTEVLHNRIEGANVAPQKSAAIFFGSARRWEGKPKPRFERFYPPEN